MLLKTFLKVCDFFNAETQRSALKREIRQLNTVLRQINKIHSDYYSNLFDFFSDRSKTCVLIGGEVLGDNDDGI